MRLVNPSTAFTSGWSVRIGDEFCAIIHIELAALVAAAEQTNDQRYFSLDGKWEEDRTKAR